MVAAVFIRAAFFLSRRLWRAWTGRSRHPFSQLEVVSLILAGAGAMCVIDGYIEPYFPQVTHVAIRMAKFDSHSSPVRIVLISDVHADTKLRGLKKLPELIRAQHPDLICFTGDAVNESEDNFRWLMSEFSKIAPVYAVRGNWDPPSRPASYAGLPVTLLEDSSVKVRVRDHDIVIGGLPTESIVPPKILFRSATPTDFRLFLHHYPDEMEQAKEALADLYLAGHTHGGQIRLPYYGALITFSRFDKKYEAGLFSEGATYMYVNRGVGMEGGPAPRVGFLNRPEVTVIDVEPTQ
jgi:predicted MPP superfamily phosphohydrolase